MIFLQVEFMELGQELESVHPAKTLLPVPIWEVTPWSNLIFMTCQYTNHETILQNDNEIKQKLYIYTLYTHACLWYISPNRCAWRSWTHLGSHRMVPLPRLQVHVLQVCLFTRPPKNVTHDTHLLAAGSSACLSMFKSPDLEHASSASNSGWSSQSVGAEMFHQYTPFRLRIYYGPLNWLNWWLFQNSITR